MNDRPFYKRSEFYLSILALAFGALLGSGLIGPGTYASKMLGMIVEVLAVMGYSTGRTLAKLTEGGSNPGWQTSEFWTCLVGSGLAITQSFDIVSKGSEAEGTISAILAALPASSYAVARGKLKADTFISMLVLVVGLSAAGCATWKSETTTRLQEAHALMKSTSLAGEKLIGDSCTAKAVTCRDQRRTAEAAGDKSAVEKALTCEPLSACHAKLKTFNTSLIAGQLALLDGLAAVELGEAVASKDLQAILTRLRELITAAQKTVAEFGGRL